MLWKKCVSVDFHEFIFREKHFLYLNGKKYYVSKDCRNRLKIYWWKWKNNYNQLRDNLCQFKEISQCVYSIVYPEIYCTTERCAFDLKSAFQLVFKICKDKKMLEHLGNEPSNFTKERNEKFKFEQKPLEIDDFNNVKEQELNEKRQKKTWNSWKKKKTNR